MNRIQTIIDYHANRVTGKLGVGFKNLLTGEECYVRGDERFPSASVFKVPVLVELFAQVEQGKISLDSMYTLQPKDMSPGSGILSSLSPGLTLSVRDYATLMMILSDNTGTDVIFNMVGRENIRARIDSMGLKNTRSDLNCRELIIGLYKNVPLDTPKEEIRKMFMEGKIERDDTLYTNMDVPNDVASPKDMLNIFSIIYNNQVLTPDSCKQMLEIMAKCQTNSRIPSLLPEDGPNEPEYIAHKTGTLNNVANDCGIIKTATQCYILTLFYNAHNASEEEKNTRNHNSTLLAQLSKDVFDALHR